MIRIRVEQPVERNDIIFNHCSLANFGWINGKLGDGHQFTPYLSPMDIDFPHVIPPLGKLQNFQPGYGIGGFLDLCIQWQWQVTVTFGSSCLKQLGIRPFTKTGGTWLWHDLRRYMLYFTYNKSLTKPYNLRRTNTTSQIWNDIDNIDTDLHVGMSQTQATLKFTKQVSIFPWIPTNHMSHTHAPS